LTKAPRVPDLRWVRGAVAIAFAIAALTGFLFYRYEVRARSVASLSDAAREELASLTIPARATGKLEQSWVGEGFTTGYLMAPVGPMPCGGETEAILREGDAESRIEQLAALHDARPEDLLVALALGTQLIETGRYPEAERVTTESLERTSDDEQVIAAARSAGSTLDLGDTSVSTVIHLHHALGVARLSQSATEPPWKSLKNVIGSVKTLSRRRLMGTTRGQPAWSRLLIAAPGCTSTAETNGKPALSSYDLFDNLIVAYMRGKYRGYPGIERDREREFGRAPKNYPSALHQLLLAQVERARANEWKDEAQLWALSNVEQVIDWRLPDDARLAVNSVQVIDWWMAPERCPADVCTPELVAGMQPIRDQLIEQVFRRRNVGPDQRVELARAAVRLLATSTLDRKRITEHAAAIKQWLPPKEAGVLQDLLNADAARAALPRWAFLPPAEGEDADTEPPYAQLGARGERWRQAAATDLAAGAAQWAATRPPHEQRHALIAIRQLLGAADAPPELTALESRLSWTDRLRLRLSASRLFWAIISSLLAALLWLVLVWIIAHERERRLLRVSLYNVEYDYLAAGEPQRPRERR
jgi:hypothetical protein